MPMTKDEIHDIFTYHAATPERQNKYGISNREFERLAHILNETLPDGPGKTVAIRKLSEARMQANQCIAMDGKF